MSRAQDFLHALQARADGKLEAVDTLRERQQAEWTTDLASLRADVERWMAPLVRENAAKVTSVGFSLSEPDVGNYVAPGLTIELVVGSHARTVRLQPRGGRVAGLIASDGARVVGAQGRVDLECDLVREVLLRFRRDGVTSWRSYTTGDERTLDEDLFFQLLARVTQVELPTD